MPELMFGPPTRTALDRAIPAAVQQRAAAWLVYFDFTEGLGQVRCSQCAQSVGRLVDLGGTPYRYAPDQIGALVLGHVLQCHRAQVWPGWQPGEARAA